MNRVKLILGLAAMPLASLYVLLGPGYSAPAPRPVDQHAAMAESGCRTAQRFVAERLLAPSTARWQNCLDAPATYQGRGRWTVDGYVDAQNGFGARIRNTYRLELQQAGLAGGNDVTWRLVTIEIQ